MNTIVNNIQESPQEFTKGEGIMKRRFSLLSTPVHLPPMNFVFDNDQSFDLPAIKQPFPEPSSTNLINIFSDGGFGLADVDDLAVISSEEESSVDERPAKKAKTTKKSTNKNKFRPYQADKWAEKYDELVEFRMEHCHCLVPHTFPANAPLARWVKRQRYQYKLLQDGKQSSMTQNRIKILEDIGFVWDSHEAAWQERLKELLDYRQQNGNCLVPSNYPENRQLATWVKCQRRQYKLYWEGRPSNMTVERIMILEKEGFEWELRSSSFSKKPAGQQAKAISNFAPALDDDNVYDKLFMDLVSDFSDDDSLSDI